MDTNIATPMDTNIATPMDFHRMSNDDNVKMFTTTHGKSIALTKDGVIIQCNESTFMVITDGMGIDIVTAEDILVNATGKVSLTCDDTATLRAREKIDIYNGEGHIEVNPAEIWVRADEIKMTKHVPESDEEDDLDTDDIADAVQNPVVEPNVNIDDGPDGLGPEMW